jgi:hypothetical protein
MGFLIGKSNEALTEIETTAQRISFDAFIDSSRSINKTLQTYQYKEKGSFKYEMSFLSDSDYRAITNIARNRNSLREGLFTIPIPYSHYSNASILVPSTTTNKAYSGNSTNKPWEAALNSLIDTEFTTIEYDSIDTYDIDYVNLAAVTAKYNYMIFSFDLSSFVSLFDEREIRRLTLCINGMNSSPIRFFAYSPTSENWYNIEDYYYYDSTAFDAPYGEGLFSLNKQLVASLALPWGLDSIATDFLSSNKVYFMAVTGAVNQSLIAQYVRCFVNGYWVSPASVLDLENFATAFTGAGRTGNLELQEI